MAEFPAQEEFNFEEQYEIFSSRLKLIQEKFTKEWLGEKRRKGSEAAAQRHIQAVQSCEDMIAKLKNQIRLAEEIIKQNKQVQEERKVTVENFEKELKELKIHKDKLIEEGFLKREQLNSTTEQLENLRKDVESLETTVSTKRGHLQKGLKYFRERLGLEFRKVDDDNLQIIFKYIDDKDPERLFSFTTMVDDQGKYHITSCKPTLKAMDKMLEELNHTNNFSSFVIKVRREFKEIAGV